MARSCGELAREIEHSSILSPKHQPSLAIHRYSGVLFPEPNHWQEIFLAVNEDEEERNLKCWGVFGHEQRATFSKLRSVRRILRQRPSHLRRGSRHLRRPKAQSCGERLRAVAARGSYYKTW